MCGIVAANWTPHQNIIDAAIQSVANRGPFGSKYCPVDSGFLAHTLLPLFTHRVETALQPLESADGQNYICVNGEVYNYVELRRYLEHRGYTFTTGSDSEVLLHGIHCEGINFLRRVNGEFCLVHYSRTTKIWTCAVDRWGTKPLRYYYDRTRFCVASTVAALRELGIPIGMDILALLSAYNAQVLPLGRTLYNSVHSIPPGHYMTYHRGTVVTTKWTHESMPHDDYDIDQIEQLLVDGIRARAATHHTPIGIALSSGIDSASIAYYLHKSDIDYRCYTIDFVDSEYSERKDVEAFCARHGMTVDVLSFTRREIRQLFPQSIINCETLAINTHTTGKLALNQHMLKNHLVCMTGDGADELFWGYTHFHGGEPYQFVANSEMTSQHYKALLRPEFVQYLKNSVRESHSSPRDAYIAHWLNEHGLKMVGDSQSASVGQEHRYPFLDEGLYQYVHGITNSQQLNSPGKAILRKIVARWDPITAAIPKRPFTAPIVDPNWMPLYEQYVLDNKRLHDLQIFDRAALESWMRDSKSSMVTTQILSTGILLTEVCDG